jgi:molybdopterin converting factor small subunit
MPSVRLFASLRELAGARVVALPGSNVDELLRAAAARFGPEFDRIARAGSVVVGGERAAPDRSVGDEDDVAFLPPFSGGARHLVGRRAVAQPTSSSGTMTVARIFPVASAIDAGTSTSGAPAGRNASS